MPKHDITSIETDNDALERVGGKGRSLAQMMRASCDVPSGFLLSTAAYRDFVSDHNLQTEILALAHPEIMQARASFETAATAIRQLFANHELPAALKKDLKDAYDALPSDNPAVAVRSSANAEDLPGLSFAGQQETYLNISGHDALIASVRDCWASLWTPQAIACGTGNAFC